MLDNNTIEQLDKIATPFYFYDMNLFHKTVDRVAELAAQYNMEIHYAIKANFNPRLLKIIADAGLGADCVSGGEVAAALEAGVPASKIVFAGVGKTDKEIYDALDQLERLQNAFDLTKRERDKLHIAIAKSISYNSSTAETYKRVASLCDNDIEKAEFLGKAAGLLEASRMLKKYMEGEQNVG